MRDDIFAPHRALGSAGYPSSRGWGGEDDDRAHPAAFLASYPNISQRTRNQLNGEIFCGHHIKQSEVRCWLLSKQTTLPEFNVGPFKAAFQNIEHLIDLCAGDH